MAGSTLVESCTSRPTLALMRGLELGDLLVGQFVRRCDLGADLALRLGDQRLIGLDHVGERE